MLRLTLALAALVLLAPAPAAAETCARLMQDRGQTFLVNACNECRMVTVKRSRPGSSAPTHRRFTLPAKTHQVLSFRGPGHTRIGEDTSCHLPGETAENLPNVNDGQRCIQLMRLPGDAGIGASNTCRECRAVIIERSSSGKVSRRKTYSIAPGGTLPVPDEGFSKVKLLGESDCR
ncbi:MAG: hypothetical protein KDE22_11280 [Rhodobacterales bacterium]|nr:hypothetical protein [Rhodobacterales bacterium]